MNGIERMPHSLFVGVQELTIIRDSNNDPDILPPPVLPCELLKL